MKKMRRRAEERYHDLSLRQQQMRSRRRIRRLFTLSFFSILLILTLSIGCFRIWSQAREKQESTLYKYYTRIEIQYGDTLWDIASRYYDDSYESYDAYIKEVMLVNRMTEPDISAGSYLVIPYHSSEFLQ